MADKIRGITVELGGDTTGLSKALKNVNSEISGTQKQLKDVERLLKLDPTNTELLKQKQALLADAVSETKTKLDALQEAQKHMDENGIDRNSDQYMALQREIISTQNNLKELEDVASKSNAVLSQIGATADKVAAGAEKAAQKTKALSLAAGGALTALGGMAYKAATNADDLNTLAKQTGFTTAEIQKMQYASDLIDVSLDDITGAAAKMKKNMVSTSSSVTEAWNRLGISVTDSEGHLRNSTDVFYEAIEALSGIENETERDTVAMALFGKSADSLAGIVDDGGQALKELGQQAEDAGLILSQETLDSLNAVNDKVDTLKATATATMAEVGAKAVEELMPTFELVMEKISALLEWIGSLDSETVNTIITILAVVAAISPLASAIAGVSSAVSFVTTDIIPGVSKAMNFLTANPIALLVAAIVALVALIASKGDEIQAVLQKVDDFFQNIFATDFTNIFGPVLGEVLNGFFANVKNIWDSVKQIFDGIIDFIRGVFTGDWQRAWNGIKEIFSGVFNGLIALAKAPLNGIIGLLNGAINGINHLISGFNSLGFTLPDWLGGGSWHPSLPYIGSIPYLAKGGILSSGSAIVGEAGPELLTMSGSKAIVQPLGGNTDRMETLLGDISGKLGGGDIKIVVQSVLDGRVIGETVTNYQRQKARSYGV